MVGPAGEIARAGHRRPRRQLERHRGHRAATRYLRQPGQTLGHYIGNRYSGQVRPRLPRQSPCLRRRLARVFRRAGDRPASRSSRTTRQGEGASAARSLNRAFRSDGCQSAGDFPADWAALPVHCTMPLSWRAWYRASLPAGTALPAREPPLVIGSGALPPGLADFPWVRAVTNYYITHKTIA